MRLLRQPASVTAWSRRLHRDGVIIGFVPTMGAIHAGHRALMRAARLACDALVVSLFVNPTQFEPHEDFARYPRPFASDAHVCREEGVDVLFSPPGEAMYPSGFQTEVNLPRLAARWEGAARPHHFAGVATVVTKLLSIVQADVAYFGQKDFQQSVLVRQLVSDLNLPTRIVVHPTVRDADGLALSSRNAFLSPAERRLAPLLFQALTAGARLVRKGNTSGAAVRQAMLRVCQSDRHVAVDYLAVCDPKTLEPLSRLGREAVLIGAIRVGSVRLIDNLLVRIPRHP